MDLGFVYGFMKGCRKGRKRQESWLGRQLVNGSLSHLRFFSQLGQRQDGGRQQEKEARGDRDRKRNKAEAKKKAQEVLCPSFRI